MFISTICSRINNAVLDGFVFNITVEKSDHHTPFTTNKKKALMSFNSLLLPLYC